MQEERKERGSLSSSGSDESHGIDYYRERYEAAIKMHGENIQKASEDLEEYVKMDDIGFPWIDNEQQHKRACEISHLYILIAKRCREEEFLIYIMDQMSRIDLGHFLGLFGSERANGLVGSERAIKQAAFIAWNLMAGVDYPPVNEEGDAPLLLQMVEDMAYLDEDAPFEDVLATGWVDDAALYYMSKVCLDEDAVQEDDLMKRCMEKCKINPKSIGDVMKCMGDDVCVVCMEPMLLTGLQTKLPCGHILHAACVNKIKESDLEDNCPLCRTQMFKRKASDVLLFLVFLISLLLILLCLPGARRPASVAACASGAAPARGSRARC
jgi:hypothetical protein